MEAKSTHGLIRLSEYTSQGTWVMLFSHPSDFTPVCLTEFIEFAKRSEKFERLNVQLIGVSIDSVPSHIAWVRDLEQMSGLQIKFPVIADLDQKVSHAYGLVHEAVSDTATVRAVFAIDPSRSIRALLYYPQQLGRNVDELLRISQALQTVDANGLSTPADWVPADQVLVPVPATMDEAARRTSGGGAGLNVKSLYLSTKELASAR